MSTVTLQGDLSTAFSYTGHITKAAGAQLQVPIPPRYLEMSEAERDAAICAAREKLGSR